MDYYKLKLVVQMKGNLPSLLIIIVILALFTPMGRACEIPIVFNCSDIQTKCDGASKIVALPNTKYDCPSPLSLSAPQLDIQGTYSSLILTGDNITLSNVTTVADLAINVSQSISISWQINVGGMLVIVCNTSQSATSEVIGAVVIAKKIIMLGLALLTIEGSSLSSTWNLCLYQNISIVQVSNYINQSIENGNVSALTTQNISIFILSQNSIYLEASTLTGVSIVINAENAINLNQSIINATAQSCRTNTGLGRGAIIQYGNTYCTSGSSSCGFGEISNANLCSDIIQYFLFLSHSFPYISKGPYLFTGSGGYGYNYQQNNQGAGGGIIFIYAKAEMILYSSKVQASGGNVDAKDNLSAGSGGTVFINAKKLVGLGPNNISANGGNSSNDQGGGGGGLVKVSYSSVAQDPTYSLWININQGYQNNSPNISLQSNGIFYGPLCHGGNMAYYLGCISCNYSYFSTLGDPICRRCPSSEILDTNQSYINKSLISNCFSIKKESSVMQLLSPGAIDLLNISIYLITLIIFTIVGVILKKKIKKEKMLSGEEFKLEDVQKDIDKAKILALELRKSKDIKPYELMYHAHRISCFGSNSQSSPWVLPSNAPHQVRQYVLPQVYCNFAENFNAAARWSKTQYWLTILSSLVYPVYWYYLDRVKKRKYKKLGVLLENAIDFNLINNYDYEDRSIVSIKFSKNKDYTNCYLDFFVYQRADLKYFTLASPYILYLSGEGNFLRPFYLEEGDIFFRLMFFVVNREFLRAQEAFDEKKQLFSNMVSQKKKQKNNFELNRFLRKLNTLACTLDLSASNKVIVQVLWSLVVFIEKWNQQFFNKMAVQLDLVVFMSHLMNRTIIDNQIHILTKKDKQQFETFVMEKIKQMATWEESSIKIGLFVYNPEQQLPKEDEVRRSLLEENELLLSGEEHDEAFMRSLLISKNKIQKKKLPKRILSQLVKGIGFMRYFMMSHKNSKYDEYTIKFLQSFLILLQTMLVFIWSIRIEIPYVFVNLVMPFIGIIWFVSDSYGFGKLYLIFNAMTLINEIVTIIVYSWIESVYLSNVQDYDLMIIRNIICSLINILIIVFMMFLGNRAITQSKKLSLKKEDESQPLKFE